MNILVVGLSHKSAPVAVRERVAFKPTEMERPLLEFLALPAISEGIIVSTCNRVELYAASRDPETAVSQMRSFLTSYHGLDPESLDENLYEYQGEEAIRHVFRVASSLDSMVIGEPQILGQIKTSYGYAAEFKTAGLILNRFLHKAFSVAKRVRTETNIAGNAVSVAFAAVELARKIFGSLEGKTVLLIGAGEMCELAARHFMNNGVSQVHVTNRTFERAVNLAAEFKGRAIAFEDFPDHLHQVDIVLTSTGASTFILGPKKVEEVIRQRKNKPMFFIDIAVPRDIDPRVNDVANVYLYDVDDLQGVIAANMKERLKEAKKAEEIVEEEIESFLRWLATLDVVPTIVALRNHFEAIRRAEVDKTLGAALKNLGEKERRSVEALTSAIINKLLHAPTALLKQEQNDNATDSSVDAVRTLFNLAPPKPEGKLEDLDAGAETEER